MEPARAVDHHGRLRREPRAEPVGIERRAEGVGQRADVGGFRREAGEGRHMDGGAGVGKPCRGERGSEGGDIAGFRPRTWIEPRALTSMRPLPNRRAASISATNCAAPSGGPGGSRESNPSPVAMGRAMVGQALRRVGAVMTGLIPDRGDGCIWGSARRLAAADMQPCGGRRRRFAFSALTRFAAASSN